MKGRILLIRNTAPENYGGGESYQIILAKQLEKNDYQPIIVTSSNRLIEEAKKANIKTIRAPYLKKQNWSGLSNLLLPIYLLQQKKLYSWYKKLIKKYRPTAIDIQSKDEWIAATKAGRKLKVQVLWTDHIDFRTWVLQNVEKRFKNYIGKQIIKLSKIPKAIIMISDYEKKFFDRYAKTDNVVVIKNGVSDELKNYKNTKVDKKSVLYIGRLVDYKGINELIDAFEEVSKKHPEATLDIYGDGEKADEYKKKAAKNSKIVFHGYTDKPLEKIAQSSIFVLPSYYEGLSMSLLDAAMMKKRIIATNVDGNPEVLHDSAGILIPPKDSKKLAEAINKLLEDEAYGKTLAENARKNYEEEFNFEKTIKEVFIPLIEKD